MKRFLFGLLCLASTLSVCSQEQGPVPAPHQLKWHEAEMGVVFHYDLHVFDGQIYGQGNNRINPVEDYNIFKPERSLPCLPLRMKRASACGRAT